MQQLFHKILLPVFLLFPGMLQAQLWGAEFGYERLGSDVLRVDMVIYHPPSVVLPDTMEYMIDQYVNNPPTYDITKRSSVQYCDSVKRTLFDTIVQPFDGSLLAFIDSSFHREHLVNTSGDVDSMYSFSTRLTVDGFSYFESNSGRFFDKGLKRVEKGDSLIYHPAFSNPDGDRSYFNLQSIGDSVQHWLPEGMEANPKSGEISWRIPDSMGTGNYEIGIAQHEYNSDPVVSQNGTEYKHFTVQVVDSLPSQASFQEISGFTRNDSGYIERRLKPGEGLNLTLAFEDPSGDSLLLEAVGEPFSQTPSPFYFTSTQGDSVVNASFSWTPDSSQVREYPYILTFIGKSYPSGIWEYKTVMIYVEDPTTSIEEEKRKKDQNSFTIRPNPAEDELFLSSSPDLTKHELRILNAQGRIVKEVQLQPGDERIDVQDLDSGIYFLVVQGRDGRWQERFVKR